MKNPMLRMNGGSRISNAFIISLKVLLGHPVTLGGADLDGKPLRQRSGFVPSTSSVCEGKLWGGNRSHVSGQRLLITVPRK